MRESTRDANHFRRRMDDTNLVEDGRAVVGDCHLAIATLNHLVHALGTETRAHSIGDGLGGKQIARPNLQPSECGKHLVASLTAVGFSLSRNWPVFDATVVGAFAILISSTVQIANCDSVKFERRILLCRFKMHTPDSSTSAQHMAYQM